jgi:hypothetical protein
MAKFISTSWYAELYNLCNTGPIEYSMTSDLRQYYIDLYTRVDEIWWSTCSRRWLIDYCANSSRDRGGKKYKSVLYVIREIRHSCVCGIDRITSNNINQIINRQIYLSLWGCHVLVNSLEMMRVIYCAPDIDSRKQQPTARLSHLDLAIASRLLLMNVLYCTTYTDCSYCHYIPIPRNSWLSLVLAPVQIYLSPGNVYSTRSRI